MALHLVTGYAGYAHVRSEDEGSLSAGLYGSGGFVLNRNEKFAARAESANVVRISSGDMLFQGRHIRLPALETVAVQIDSGTSGQQRHDIIVCRYKKTVDTGVESVSFLAIKGTPAIVSPEDPDVVTGNITDDGDTTADFPLYRVELDGINVTGLIPLFSVVEPLTENHGNVGLDYSKSTLSANMSPVTMTDINKSSSNYGKPLSPVTKAETVFDGSTAQSSINDDRMYRKCTVRYSGWSASTDSSGWYTQTVSCNGIVSGMPLDAPKALAGSTAAEQKNYQKALNIIAAGVIVPGTNTLTFKVAKKTSSDVVIYIRKASYKE